jgi:hypothetical protein
MVFWKFKFTGTSQQGYRSGKYVIVIRDLIFKVIFVASSYVIYSI